MSARKKVTVIGGGMTGGAIAQRLVERGIADVVIQDDPQFAGTFHHGKALDETQAASWLGFDTKITATDGWDATANSDVVVVTAGAPRKPGMSREELLNGNADIVRAKVTEAAKASPNSVIIIFSNPMDAMCHVALKASGRPSVCGVTTWLLVMPLPKVIWAPPRRNAPAGLPGVPMVMLLNRVPGA